MNVRQTISFFFAALPITLLLTNCGPDLPKKELSIVLITDHAISEGESINNDLKALLEPIYPNEDQNWGYIPQLTVFRADVSKENMYEIDLSDWRSHIPLLPQNDFTYAAESRKNLLDDLHKPFEIETRATQSIKVNIDSLVAAKYPESIVIQFDNERSDLMNYFNHKDSMTKFINSEIYKANYDASKPIVIVYKTRTHGMAARRTDTTAAPVQLDFEPKIKDCSLTWINDNPSINYKITLNGYSRNLGNVGFYDFPKHFRNKNMDIVICAYMNGYNKLIECKKLNSKPCLEPTIQEPKPSVNEEQLLGDMKLRIENGNITWEQLPNVHYRIMISYNPAKIENPPLELHSFEGKVGIQVLGPSDPSVRNYVKKDFMYLFKIDAYDRNPAQGGSVRLACVKLPKLRIPSMGQGAGIGFYDEQCIQDYKPNFPCK